MSDLIDRQDAIALFYKHPNIDWTTLDVMNELKSLPSAQPEQKKGKWIDNKGLYQCSCCKHIWSELWWIESCPIDRMNKIMRFCPNCGAEMRERREDEHN